MHDDGDEEPQGTLEGGLGVHGDSDGGAGLEVRRVGEDGSAAPCADGEASGLGMESGEQCSDCVGTATTIEAIFCTQSQTRRHKNITFHTKCRSRGK